MRVPVSSSLGARSLESLRLLAVRLLLTLVCAVAAASAAGAVPADLLWQSFPGGRFADVTPSGGATNPVGFTLLTPDQTGVLFTNSLQEWEGASNRVLLNGAGVATGDFDNDGWPDLFFCSLNGRNTLCRNLGGWRFADVTEQAGLTRDSRYYRGAVFADVNGDGWLDLMLGVVGGGVQCWMNDGHGKFSDATLRARTGTSFAVSTLALADIDGNGTLDLYVANNRVEDIRDRGRAELRLVDGKLAVPPELQDRLLILNGQVQEFGEPDQLYSNDGQGRFAPVSWTGGRFRTENGGLPPGPPRDWGLTATFRDLNNDGFPDLYVCNDFWTPDRVWINDGKGRFQMAPPLALRNMPASSMGVDFADIDRDGQVDFFVVDMLSRDPRLRKRQKLAQALLPAPIGAIADRPQFMRNTLFVGRGDGTFAEMANFAGLAASDWSWSPVFLDVDLDGYEDLLITAGHARDVQDLDAQAQVQARQHSWKGFTNEVERQKTFTRELLENMRLYPELRLPIVAFRNRGDRRFEEKTPSWGTESLAVHHAIALADFDRDGDLDLVVNNLGSPAGLYRNNASAGRVAVRLRGRSPNTQGIGSKVTLRGGPVPEQTQEVVSGGRYLAGSDPMLAFAAGPGAGLLTLEVRWRSGALSRVEQVAANRIYELEEPAAGAAAPASLSVRPAFAVGSPWFEDATQALQHRHQEEPFDDFGRQPWLPRHLSQAGPPVAWIDLDEDGREDLVIGSGRGGRMAGYHNEGQGRFAPMGGPAFEALVGRAQTSILGWPVAGGGTRLLVAASSYEEPAGAADSVQQFDPQRGLLPGGLPDTDSSAGSLALGDLDGDGNLDLFVGGRVVPGRYPEAASSRLFRGDGQGRWQLDAANSRLLEKIGLVSGALWSDLDGDGWPELVVACEWGPIRVFQNDAGKLREATAALGLAGVTGWWNGVTTADLDGDGQLEILASNWGWNTPYRATAERPLLLFYGDLMDRGLVDGVETEWEPGGGYLLPLRRLDQLAVELPVLLERFRTHRAYTESSLEAVLGPLSLKAQKLSVTTLASTVFTRRGRTYVAEPMPVAAQLSPAFGLAVADFDGDGADDLFLSQNFFAWTPETPRSDAGRGLILRGDGTGGLRALLPAESGIGVDGEQRGAAVSDFDGDGRVDLVIGQNGAATRLYHNRAAKPGVRVRLAGPPGNRDGIGARLRLKSGEKLGPAREIHGGAGYASQDGAVQVMAFPRSLPSSSGELWVRWPGGKVSVHPVPADGRLLVAPIR